MGRRQSQRKCPQLQSSVQSQENQHEKRPQRRKHKSNTSSTKCGASQHSAQESSMSHQAAPEDHTMKIKVSSAAKLREPKLTGQRALLCHSPDQQGELSAQPDSDTDLSESERLPLSFSPVPPRLELKPEVIQDEDVTPHSQRVKGRDHGGFDFPDFLPPPFNSWSLSQLAVFYNTEGRGMLRPRSVGPLERYLERLLQLEWEQIQSVQAEAPFGTSGSQRSAAAVPSRLSSPRCILQCQRAFPLTFLSSLSSHSTLLLGCACALCRTCGSVHSHQSRLSPTLDHSRRPAPLPKRSYSESRVLASDRTLRAQTSTNSYLRRMQASGNIRNPIQGALRRSPSSVRRGGDHAGRGGSSDRTVGAPRGERPVNGSQSNLSSSECRAGRAEIKSHTLTAVIDNLLRSKNVPVLKQSKSKQVEFVT